MTENNTTYQNFTPKKKNSWSMMSFFAIFLLVASIGYVFQLRAEKALFEKNIAESEQNIQTIKNNIKTVRSKDNVSDLLVANEIFETVSAEKTEWSDLFTEIMKLEQQNITIANVTTGKNRSVTATGEAENYPQVVNLIKLVKANDLLQDHFVESAIEQKTSGFKTQTTKKVQFQLRFTYSPEKL